MNTPTSPEINAAPLPSSDTLRRLAISESGFVFDPVSGHHFTVNETGLDILKRLQKNRELPALLNALQQEYDITVRDLERDVLDFVGTLRDLVGD